ncbi:hypothetical protein [Syntrophothermus lipocalidus]|uniref:hypothetical protein n=1 Tax=Syntrophothermus lipocalidus TaxID=86170 RepID=UPI00059E651D|nr:hypothetical protein [Syntrophothermus lipocalidus]
MGTARRTAYYMLAGIALLCISVGKGLIKASPSVFEDFLRALPRSRSLFEAVLFGLGGIVLGFLLTAAVIFLGTVLYGAGRATEWGSRRVLPELRETT